MEFHAMKRKQLQALCKKHGILANMTNREMAHLLASALKVNEPPCSQNMDEGEIVEEEDDAEALRHPKRVRFSPEVETREYEPTARKQRGRVTRSRGKLKETSNEDEIEQEALPAKSPRTLRNERRKLVQECVVPEELRRRGKRNMPKSIDSGPMISAGSNSCDVGGRRITRLRERSQSTSNTSVVNKEDKSPDLKEDMRRSRRKNVVFDTVDQAGVDESVGLEEIPRQVKRISSRQKSRIRSFR
ncbi:hypothetical protein LINGRAHAP2_LOCUS33095 [Linum grandiflorum]